MVFILLLITLLVFFLISKFLKTTTNSLTNYIDSEVEQYFKSKGFGIISISDGFDDPESPFKNEWTLLPAISHSTSRDIFNHRIYKIELKNEHNNKSIIWVDCFYFMKYNLWFDTREQTKI